MIRAGKEGLFGYFGDGIEPRGTGQGRPACAFVGQVMKATQGKANPQQVNELLKKKLSG